MNGQGMVTASTVSQLWKTLRQGGVADLPVRELRLKFDLPHLLRERRGRPETNPGRLNSDLNEHVDKPLEMMEFSIAYLESISRHKVSARKRLALLDLVLRHNAALIGGIYLRYRDQPGVPESEARRCNIDRASSLLRNLITGYEQVFSHDYTLPDFLYAHSRERLQVVGARILELIFSLQRFHAMRYQPLTSLYWRDCNQVFFILRQYEKTDVPMRLSGCIRMQLRGGPESNGAGNQMATAEQLYLGIQLLGIVDPMTWPSHQVHIIDAYLKHVEPRISIKPDQPGDVPSAHVLTMFALDRPPLYARGETWKSGLLIDVGELKKQINNDHASVFSLPPAEALEKISPPLSVLDDEDRQLFIDTLRQKLHPRQRRDHRNIINEFRDMNVFFGFMAVHNRLISEQQPKRKSEKAKDTLAELLAGRSAMLAEDSREVSEGQWFVVNDSEGGLNIKTRETRYTTSMSIGQMVLIRKLQGTGEPQLGYVARLGRLNGSEISVVIVKISSYIEAVAIQNAEMHRAEQAWPAFLMRNVEGRWQLALHSNNKFESGQQVFVRRNKQITSVLLGEVAHSHQEFFVYSLRAASA